MEETNPLLSEEDRLGLSNAAPIDSSEWTGGDPNAVSAPLPEAVVEEQLVEETLTSEEPAETSAPVQGRYVFKRATKTRRKINTVGVLILTDQFVM